MGASFFILKLNYKLNFKVPVEETCSCVRQEKKPEVFSEFLVLHMCLSVLAKQLSEHDFSERLVYEHRG